MKKLGIKVELTDFLDSPINLLKLFPCLKTKI